MSKIKRLYENTYASVERYAVDLTLSENPLGCSDKVKKAIEQSLDQIHLYPHNEDDLIHALADYHHVSANNIIIGAGANQLLEDIFRIFALGKGVLSPAVTFPEPLAYINTLGGYAETVELKPGFSIDCAALLNRIDERIGLIYLCNPNNPTGKVIPTQDIISLSKQSQIPVVVSEAGADFVGSSLVNQAIANNIIVVRSFSKAYGLAGLRVGYVVANKDYIAFLKRHISAFRVNYLAIVAALAALDDQNHLSRCIEYVSCEKRYLSDEMQKLNFEVVHSEGQTFIAKVPKCFNNATDFCVQAKEYGISVVDCSLYSGLENYIRIAPQKAEINKKFISLIKKIVKQSGE